MLDHNFLHEDQKILRQTTFLHADPIFRRIFHITAVAVAVTSITRGGDSCTADIRGIMVERSHS